MDQMEQINLLDVSEQETRRKELEEEFSYEGYKYVRSEFFANLREPAITIRDGSITFNTACINGLEDVVYVNAMIHEGLKRIVVKGCSENDKDALRWCVAKPDKRKSRKMNCPGFTDLVFQMMNWEKGFRYKIMGYKINFEGQTLYVFDLNIYKMYHETSKDKKDVASTEESKDEKKNSRKKQDRKGFYPDDIAGSFGIPVEEHDKEKEVQDLNGYVSIGALTGNVAHEDKDATEEPIQARQGTE